MNKLLLLLNMVVLGFTITNIVLMNDINKFRIQDTKDVRNRVDKLNMFAISVCLIITVSMHALMCVSMYMSRPLTIILSMVAVGATSYIAYFNEQIKDDIEGFQQILGQGQQAQAQAQAQVQAQAQAQVMEEEEDMKQQQSVENIFDDAKDVFKNHKELIYIFNYIIVGASSLFLLMMLMSMSMYMMGNKKTPKSAAPVKKKSTRK